MTTRKGRLCLECAHCGFDEGTGGSDLTPPGAHEYYCEKGLALGPRFRGLLVGPDSSYDWEPTEMMRTIRNLSHAETCPEFKLAEWAR